MYRRDFIRTSLGLAGALAASRALRSTLLAEQSAPAIKRAANDLVTLGPEKLSVTRLALGTGTNGVGGSSNQTRQLGIKGLSDFLRYCYDNEGLVFWDSADQYGSHPHLKEALKSVPREKITLLTKTHAETAEQAKKDIDRFRQELGVDMIDILLLHCVTDANWPEKLRGAMDYISEAKQNKIVRTHGVSCHTFSALKAAAREPWVEVDLARINPAGAIMDAPPDQVVPVLREMKAAGKGVIGMKIFGAGKLLDRKEACLNFVLGLDCVDCFTMGFESVDQLKEVRGLISKAA